MARYGIYHKGASAPFCYADSLELADKWMGECVVSVDVTSAVPLDFCIGDYIDYLGERFSICNDTGVLKQARRNTYGGAFKYSGVKFYNRAEELKHCRFKDVTYDKYDAYYVAGTEFSLHCDDVKTLVERIVINLNRGITDDADAWTMEVGDNTESATNVDVTVSNISCWEALQLVATQFKTSAYVKGKVIHIGNAVSTGNATMRYGKENGLVTIEKTYSNDDAVITRLRVYGNKKNMPTGYYSDIFEPILKFEILPTIDNVDPEAEPVKPGKSLYFRVVNLYNRGAGVQLLLEEHLKNRAFYDEEHEFVLRLGVQLSSRQGNIQYSINGGEKTGSAMFLESRNRYSDFLYVGKASDFFGYDESLEKKYYVKDVDMAVTNGLPTSWIRSLKQYWLPSRPIAPVGLSITRLMLPDFMTEKDGKIVTDAYIDDADAIAKYGIREGSVFFDNEETGDIYPTIEGMRAESVKAAGYDWIKLPEGDNGRMDEILWCENPADDGYISNTDAGDDEHPKEYFDMYLKDLGFDILSYLSTEGSPTIVMRSGDCSGMEFEVYGGSENVKRVKLYYHNNALLGDVAIGREFSETLKDGWNEDDWCYAWKLRLKRYNSGELSIAFPNSLDGNKITGRLVQMLRPGDKDQFVWHSEQFVITNIEMPSLYIKEAAARLEIAAREYLKEHNHAKSQYNVKLDSVFMQRDADAYGVMSLRYALRAGKQFYFADSDIDPDDSVSGERWYIDTYNIKESGDRLPEYSVTLKQDVELTTIQKINAQIVTINATLRNVSANAENTTDGVNRIVTSPGYGVGTQNGVNETDVTKIGDERYARLKEDNVFEGENVFQGETWMTTAHGEVFATNAADEDHGAAMYDDEDGNGHLVADYMSIRRAAFFRTLTIAEVQHMGGEVVLSAAACKVAKVEKLPKNMRRLYFEKRANGRETHNEWMADDLAYCKRWNAMSGDVEQFYWRLVTQVNDGETDEYWTILLSGSDMAEDSMEPQVNDEVVLLGHRNGGYRASAQVYSTVGEGAPSRRYYYGITDYTLTQPIELLEHTKDGAHWKVGGTQNYIEYNGGLQIKASSVDIVSENGELNVGDVLGEHFALLQTEMEAPFDGEDFIEVLDYSAFDVSREWGDEGSLMSHVGDYLTTSDGVSYHFVVDDDNPDEPYWEICTDQYLIAAMKEAKKATKFIAGFSSKDGFAKMFSAVEYIDAETGEVVTKEGWAGTYVEAQKDENGVEYITGFKINTDVFVCGAENFKVDEIGNVKMNNAELNSALIHGFLYSDDTIITPDEIEKYVIDENDKVPGILDTAKQLDIKKTGMNFALKGNFTSSEYGSGVQIVLPSLLPGMSVSAEMLATTRSMIGSTVSIINNTENQAPLWVRFSHKSSDGTFTSQNESHTQMRNTQCDYTCHRTFDSNGNEIIYWTKGTEIKATLHEPK